MSIYRRAARNDANQAAVIEALEGIGCLVYVIRQPVDLLIGLDGVWVPAEVKDGAKAPSARKLRPIQEQFLRAIAECNLPGITITSPEQAVLAVRQAAGRGEMADARAKDGTDEHAD